MKLIQMQDGNNEFKPLIEEIKRPTVATAYDERPKTRMGRTQGAFRMSRRK